MPGPPFVIEVISSKRSVRVGMTAAPGVGGWDEATEAAAAAAAATATATDPDPIPEVLLKSKKNVECQKEAYL